MLAIGIPVNYKKQKSVMKKTFAVFLITFLFPILINSIIQTLLGSQVKVSTMKITIRYINIFYGIGLQAFLHFFCFLLLGIRFRLVLINQAIQESKDPERLASKCISTLANLLIKLNEISSSVNKIFSIIVMLFLGYSIGSVTLTIHEFYDAFLTKEINYANIIYCFGVSVWQLDYVFCCLYCIACCSLTSREGTRTLDLLHEHMEGSKRVQIFIYQLQHVQVSFSCGLFDFDWRYVPTVSAVD
jgi:7tm Chemosensory receptor